MVVTDEGRRRFLELRVNKVPSQDLVLMLYSNAVIPARKTRLADLVEVQGGGYAARHLIGSSWTVGAIDKKTGRIPIIYPTEVFTFTSLPSVRTVWGWGIKHDQVLLSVGFVVPPADDQPRPMLVQIVGDEIEVNPGFFEAPAED